MAMAGPTRMSTDAAARLRLASWMSPSFPVGAFAYSHGLEWSVRAGDVVERLTLTDWIETALRVGAGRSDAILLAEAHRACADATALAALAELGAAFAPSAERRLETLSQGAAFVRAAAAGWDTAPPLPQEVPYPVAVGAAAGAADCPLDETLLLFLHGFAQTLVSAGVRLIPIGQSDGQRALAALTPHIEATAQEAETATLADLGGCAFRIDLASMRHETLEPRLFRT